MIKGIKVCKQADTYWIEKFDKRVNPQGKEYYWLTGEFINKDQSEDSDELLYQMDIFLLFQLSMI